MRKQSRSILNDYAFIMAIYVTTMLTMQPRPIHAMSRSTGGGSSSSSSPSSFLSRLTTKSHVASSLAGRLSPYPSHPPSYYSPSSILRLGEEKEEEEEGQPGIDTDDLIQTCKEYIGEMRTSLDQRRQRQRRRRRQRQRRSNDNGGLGATSYLSKLLYGGDNALTSQGEYQVEREPERPSSSSSSHVTTAILRMRRHHRASPARTRNIEMRYLCRKYALESLLRSDSYEDDDDGYSISHQLLNAKVYHSPNQYQTPSDERNIEQQQDQDTAASKALLLGERAKEDDGDGDDDDVEEEVEEKEGTSSTAFQAEEERRDAGDPGSDVSEATVDYTLVNGSRVGARSKRIHRLSINQALMVLTDMVVSSQRQRRLRNDNRMRQQLLSIG